MRVFSERQFRQHKLSQHVIFPGVISGSISDLSQFISNLPADVLEVIDRRVYHKGRNMRLTLCRKYGSTRTFQIKRHSIPGKPTMHTLLLHSLIHVRTTTWGHVIPRTRSTDVTARMQLDRFTDETSAEDLLLVNIATNTENAANITAVCPSNVCQFATAHTAHIWTLPRLSFLRINTSPNVYSVSPHSRAGLPVSS